MGGHGDPYLTPPTDKLNGSIRNEGDSVVITVPNAAAKTPEQIGKIAEDLVRQSRDKKK